MHFHVSLFVIGSEFYGSANVHSLREKDRWCEAGLSQQQQKRTNSSEKLKQYRSNSSEKLKQQCNSLYLSYCVVMCVQLYVYSISS